MESNNLIIRETIFNDCALFAEFEKQDFIKEFLTIDENRSYEDVVREFIIRERDDSKEQYTIVLKNDNKQIGRVYIAKIDRNHDSLDITRIYIGDKNNIGKGYGKEAMILLLQYCFNTLKMERVTIDHYPNNYKASNLYLSLGFQYEGIMRNAAKRNNQYFDLHLMSILKNDYYKNLFNISVK